LVLIFFFLFGQRPVIPQCPLLTPLDWLGLAWTGLDWLGLACTCMYLLGLACTSLRLLGVACTCLVLLERVHFARFASLPPFFRNSFEFLKTK